MAMSFRCRSSLGVAAMLIAAAVTAVAVNSTRAPADTGASCGVAYTIAWQTPSDSPPDFGATVTVTNNSPYPISGWTVSWTYTAWQNFITSPATLGAERKLMRRLLARTCGLLARLAPWTSA
jgi:hypothetical protein